jgi:outer membrane protein
MKSNRILIVILFSLISISLNAQVFVGGNVRFNTSGHKSDNGASTTSKGSGYNLDIMPNAGKFLSEKLAIGIALNLSLSGNTSGVTTETILKSSSIGVTPFLRYYGLKWNKLSLYGQASTGFSLSNSTSKTGGVSNDGPKTTRLFIFFDPGISYDVSEKLALEASLNFLSLGYNYNISKSGNSTDNSSSFNIGGGLDNLATLGTLTIGAIYKF